MSLGKPIIGTNLAGIPEEIENNVNGFIVEVNKEEELSDAMLKFIKDRNLIKKMGQKSKEIFEQKFEYNKTIQKIICLYK
jgi:glycosyltransferase involved in cell wall biosynthesis